MSSRIVVAAGLWVALTPALALAHAGFTVPTPRDTNVQSGTSIKTPPCGPRGPGTGARTTLNAGSQFTVEFIETINHPGYFEVSFSDVGDSNYVVVLDNIAHSNAAPSPTFANPRRYSATITVPNVSCANCSLRLIQYMTENPQNPRLYFSCADIEIVGGPSPDAGVVVPPDSGVEPDSGVVAEPDSGVIASPDATVSPDATEPADLGVVVAPDSGVLAPDAGVIAAEDAAVSALDAAAPPATSMTRTEVGGGCAAVAGSDASLLAVLLAGLVALRRRRGVRSPA